jgi:hypothetical protein
MSTQATYEVPGYCSNQFPFQRSDHTGMKNHRSRLVAEPKIWTIVQIFGSPLSENVRQRVQWVVVFCGSLR